MQNGPSLGRRSIENALACVRAESLSTPVTVTCGACASAPRARGGVEKTLVEPDGTGVRGALVASVPDVAAGERAELLAALSLADPFGGLAVCAAMINDCAPRVPLAGRERSSPSSPRAAALAAFAFLLFFERLLDDTLPDEMEASLSFAPFFFFFFFALLLTATFFTCTAVTAERITTALNCDGAPPRAAAPPPPPPPSPNSNDGAGAASSTRACHCSLSGGVASALTQK